MIFFVYGEQSKAYRCYSPFTEKTAISRGVRFENDHKPDIEMTTNQTENSNFEV